MKITPSSSGEEIASMALAIHELVNRLPTTMRTKNSNGVRIEDGKIINYDYTGPVLERVLNKGTICRGIPKSGPYKGSPVVVVPVIEEGKVICAIGVVDITKGIFSDLVQIARRPELITPKMSKGEFY
ncbi:MAG: DUF2111 domain-containing protein [Euryarchaeota archaeon]|nr:DUF2111 domain-containing protein [Euryarchaeota archaeon]